MRASFNVLGPLLARCGEARVALPGGDNIGSRKVDMHLRGLEAMGARGRGRARLRRRARATLLHGARAVLEFPSVGATENLMCAAVLAKGTTVIENAAREPEVTDLADVPQPHGRARAGRGHRRRSRSKASRSCTPVDSEIMADRVEAGTLLMACGIAGGEIELVGVRPEHLEIVVDEAVRDGHAHLADDRRSVGAARRSGCTRSTSRRSRIPGFATDFMPLAVAVMTVAEGSAIVTENVYDGRFQFVDELARMGADVRTEGRHAIVRGVERLSGAPVHGLRRAGRRRARARRARGRRRDDRARRRARRAGLLRPRRPASGPSAPTSSASTTELRARPGIGAGGNKRDTGAVVPGSPAEPGLEN